MESGKCTRRATLDSMDIAALVEELGGFAQKRQLVARGARDFDLTAAVRNGNVRRARQGWYTTLGERDPRVRAVRVGGRLTGISAIAARGGWVLHADVLHVAVAPNAARLRSQFNRRVHPRASRLKGVQLHWQQSAHDDASMVGMLEAIQRVIIDESRETAIAALDWALHTGHMDEMDVALVMNNVPVGRRIRWVDLDAMCESLPESLGRTRLRDAGFAARSQVLLSNGQRIDLLVDDVVGFEVDGEQFHRDTFAQDRAKDGVIIRDGYVAYRATANAVFREWATVEATIAAAITARNGGNSGTATRRRRTRGLSGVQQAPVPEFPKLAGMGRVGRALKMG